MFEKEIKTYIERHGFEAFTPKAVLFDMDGVLYNSMPNHAVAWQKSMTDYGIHMTADDAYATEGARGVDTIRYMVKQQKHQEISMEKAQEMYDLKTRYFHEMPTAPIFDGVYDLMRQIKASGLTIGIVTGSGQRPLIKRLLDNFGEFLDEDHIVAVWQDGRLKALPERFDALGAAFLQEARKHPEGLILMDECGHLEKNSTGFRKEILDCMNGPVPVLGVLRKDQPWHSFIKEHPRVQIVEVTEENRDTLPALAAELLGRTK